MIAIIAKNMEEAKNYARSNELTDWVAVTSDASLVRGRRLTAAIFLSGWFEGKSIGQADNIRMAIEPCLYR